MRKVFDLLFVRLEKTTEGALLFLPDVHIFSHVKTGLNVSSEEGVLVGNLILGVHQGHVLGIAQRILSVCGVLELPSGSLGEFGKFPPVIESVVEIGGHFSSSHDCPLESIEFISWHTLVHLDKAG